MSDEDALLAAVAAAPLDDTPRLVYADWLEDRSDPRAEYVRLEVERHRLKPRDKRRAALSAQLEALRPQAHPDWLPRIDRVTRFAEYWSQGDCQQAAEQGLVGRPLKTQIARPHATARRGDYLYRLTYARGALYVVARARFLHTGPPAEWNPTVKLGEGTPVRFDRAVPAGLTERFGWYSGNNIRHVERRPGDGDAVPWRALLSVFQNSPIRLAPATAADFDAVLRAG